MWTKLKYSCHYIIRNSALENGFHRLEFHLFSVAAINVCLLCKNLGANELLVKFLIGQSGELDESFDYESPISKSFRKNQVPEDTRYLYRYFFVTVYILESLIGI